MSKSIFITGASRGIGLACVHCFSKLGIRVYAGVRKKEDGNKLKKNDLVTPIIIDVTKRETIEEAYKLILEKQDNLIGIINNAGVCLPKPLEFLDLSLLNTHLETNLVGPLLVTQTFLPLLKKNNGRIVMVGSMSSQVAHPFLGAYNISKFGLRAMADTYRRELLSSNIIVSLVDPGCTATPMWDNSLNFTRNMLKSLPEQGKGIYGHAIEKTLESYKNFGKSSTPPEKVAYAIVHAVLSKHPKNNYLVGNDIKLMVFLSKILPGKMFDKLICKFYGLCRGD